ncbi:helix-hairpin-helix domain-containing protein [Sunxiuqinia rutila]|uniref:helix-hairpin-helix domain-containing protein n=1 Tax=Sunxiuqinia rutila TaxID=1397841 RepID=UPI003D35E9FF
MKAKSTIKLPLLETEKAALKAHKVRLGELLNFAVDELEVLLDASPERAREIHALAEFQSIPWVGPRFAEDLVFLGYYAIDELKGLDGARLTDAYELQKGFWTDPCVEDQFRLVVHYATTHDATKKWWDFTNERKAYRLEHGYPANRPATPWHEVLPIQSRKKSK